MTVSVVGAEVYRRSDVAGQGGIVLSATDTHAMVGWDDGGRELVPLDDLVLEPAKQS